MATRDLFQAFYSEDPVITFDESSLPSFPGEQSIIKAIPGIVSGTGPLGKSDFLTWVDFTLEHPDEIWEAGDQGEKKIYNYLCFLENGGTSPLFAVEVCCSDDLMEVNNFALVVRESDAQRLRSGSLVYSLAREWERERLVRHLNEQALMKYDEDSLDEARELIDTAIRFSASGCAYLFNNRGLICWKMGKTAQAKEDFLESIGLDRDNGDPYFNIGLIYFDEADYRRALYYLRRAVDLNPADSQFLTELGHLYLELEREEEALRLFRKAFESNPHDPQVDFHLGYYFLYKKHSPRHALKYYHRGLKKDPDDQFALADLAVAHCILGNRRKSLQLHRILQKKPALMPYTMSRLVYLKMEMGDYEKALEYYHAALNQKDPFEPEWLHYHAALVYAKTGRPKQALDFLGLAFRVGGEAVIKRALTDKALQALKRTPDFKRLVKLSGKRRNR
jgi:tetratricopeptide (TPR) repeat protein